MLYNTLVYTIYCTMYIGTYTIANKPTLYIVRYPPTHSMVYERVQSGHLFNFL